MWRIFFVRALFEYISSEVLNAGPLWMTDNYLEWLARLMNIAAPLYRALYS